MQADGRDERVRKLAEHVLSCQLSNGGFSMTSRRQYHELVCLTAGLLRALVHFGYGEDQRVIRSYRRLAERIPPHGGVPCYHALGTLSEVSPSSPDIWIIRMMGCTNQGSKHV